MLLGAGLATAFLLDTWVGHEQPTLLYLAIFGSIISYIYSAPPLKLKQWGWAGNYALGSSYIALPWWAGQVCGGWSPGGWVAGQPHASLVVGTGGRWAGNYAAAGSR